MLVHDDQLAVEDNEALAIDQVGLRQTSGNSLKKHEILIIRGTGTPSALSAKNGYAAGRNLVHLLIGRDGNKLIQMTDFNRRAGVGSKFESNALIIGLANVGYLLDDVSQKSNFRHMDNFSPSERLFARGTNDRKERYWPCYPAQQMELLLQVATTLMKHYGIRFIQSYENLNINALDPGPTFPLISFIERLRQEIPHLENRPMILRETLQEIHLHTEPETGSEPIPESLVLKGALLAAIDEKDDWSLVEVLGKDEKRWIKGWVNSKQIILRPFNGVIIDNMVETDDGAAFPFIPAARGNFNSRKDSNRPKYLVMHYTTGTQIQSTINTFRNSANGVSTHLVIGRDGRVIQMVPFNFAAYHCGSGSWENDRNLNYLSIGIELDNAGRLTQIGGHWSARGHIIPDDRVKEAIHWKDNQPRVYECFPDVQLDVAFRIAKALVEHYHLVDIIGHDEISLETRYDPGPLFPLAEWRELLYGRKEPNIVKYLSKPGIIVYRDYEGIPPRLNHPEVKDFVLKNKQSVQVVRKEGRYTLIKVRKGKKIASGWVESNLLKVLPQVTKINSEKKVMFYHYFADGGPPPSKHPASPLPENTELRILKIQGNLALVITLTRLGTFPFVAGWVSLDSLHKANE